MIQSPAIPRGKFLRLLDYHIPNHGRGGELMLMWWGIGFAVAAVVLAAVFVTLIVRWRRTLKGRAKHD